MKKAKKRAQPGNFIGKFGQPGPIFHIPTLCRWDRPYRVALLDEWGKMTLYPEQAAYETLGAAEEAAKLLAKHEPERTWFVVDLTSIGPTYRPNTRTKQPQKP